MALSCSLIILLVANLPWFICGCTEVSKIERLPHAGSQRHWRVTRSRLSSRANPSSRSKCRAPSSVRALAVNTSPATPRGGHGHLLALLLHERRLPEFLLPLLLSSHCSSTSTTSSPSSALVGAAGGGDSRAAGAAAIHRRRARRRARRRFTGGRPRRIDAGVPWRTSAPAAPSARDLLTDGREARLATIRRR